MDVELFHVCDLSGGDFAQNLSGSVEMRMLMRLTPSNGLYTHFHRSHLGNPVTSRYIIIFGSVLSIRDACA